ncbi:DeSI-like protein [Symbiodinium microadriaticum]|uniref:DeSI-like protein n=2 Tax=Symbiodinium TaxID=2949 RepID=A0A1Q9ET82_SYMMI|nr:DeSI-like protein [Symbiodinium microadriaticum]
MAKKQKAPLQIGALVFGLHVAVAWAPGRTWVGHPWPGGSRMVRTCCRASACLLHRGSQLLSGKNKWLGGVLGLDGNIYCIPCNKDSVLQISTADSHISTFGSFAEQGTFKWSRGLMAGNGNIFGIPARAKSVLKISPTTKEVSTFGSLPEGKWKWHGAVVAPDGAIYCIPAEAESVLRIDPESDRAETIGDKMPGRWKWYGGLLGSDGCIYGMPYYANSVLKIDPQTGKVSTIGNLPEGSWKWHGGVVGADGAIYGIPAHAETVLKVVPATGEVKTIGGPFPGKYKWLGAVLGSNGCIYGIPYNAQSIMKISPDAEDVELIDVPLKGRNMWQGGVLGPDGAVYFIPRWAQHVLRIKEDKVSVVRGDPIAGWNKFQGGVLARDGCMYGVPQDLDAILKIQPDASCRYVTYLSQFSSAMAEDLQFIHRVGLALLTEARPALLGQSFDCTIQRLRCLCQLSQLSPEALVKVTNRLLSDLEQAITTPATSSGRGTLPCCFLERDLDRGTTHCRFLPSREGSVRDGSPKSRPAKVVDLAFLEATLPAPRVPADPLVPGPRSPEPAPKGPNAASGATSQLKSFARKSQKVFSKVRPPSVSLGLHRGLQEALSCLTPSPPAGPPDVHHHAVTLHTYDLHRLVRGVNTFFKRIPGFYHTGVEVHGREFSFSSSGMIEYCPRGFAGHLYRESMTLGATSFSQDELNLLLQRFDSTWVAYDYHCIRRNCSDFSEAFCVALGVAPPPRKSQFCACLPAKEASRNADLKRAKAARDFVEGLRETGATSQEDSSPVSTTLPSLLCSPQAGEYKEVGNSFCSSSGRNDASPPAVRSLRVATRVLLPLGCLQRSQEFDCEQQAGAEEIGDLTRLQSHSNAPRTTSTASIDSVGSESSESHPLAQLKEGKRRGRSPTVRLCRNSDREVMRAAARMRTQMKAAGVYFRKKKKEDVPWPGSQDTRWMDACGSSM